MFSQNENNTFMVYGSNVDFRKGVKPLSGLVRLLQMPPTDGSVTYINRFEPADL